MKRAKSALWAAKRIGIAVLVLGVALSALSCGKDGNIYGDVVWDGSLLYSIGGGFPSSGIVYGASYLIQPGTWSYQYNVYYLGTYYPGLASVYYGTYTVTADPGTFPLISGKDTSFELYCSIYGLAKYGSVSSIAPLNDQAPAFTPKLGTQTWTQNGLRIEVTTNIRKLSPEDLAKLSQGIRK